MNKLRKNLAKLEYSISQKNKRMIRLFTIAGWDIIQVLGRI